MMHRAAGLLLLTVTLLTSLGWTGGSWGQAKIARVGVLTFASGAADAKPQSEEPLRRTLAAHGWIEGQNLALEFRKTKGDPSQFRDYAAELVQLKVDVLCADSAPAARAAFAATRTIPIGWSRCHV